MTDQHTHHNTHSAGGTGVTLDTDGFRLANVTAPGTIGTDGEIQFTVLDPHGHTVTDFRISHQKELHLVIVRADGAHFAHVHPHRDDAGVWHLPWAWGAAGTYRLYADVVPSAADGPMTLSTTVQVAGDFAPESFDTPATTDIVDGFTVDLHGEVTAGTHCPVTISVTCDGQPVKTLEPYMGAFGHLTGLRLGDLAYLHIHPHGDEPAEGDLAGPRIDYAIMAPSPGWYVFYLDFKIAGTIHTARFILEAK